VELNAGVVSILWAMKRGDGEVPLGIGQAETLGSRRKLRLTSTAALARRKTQQAAERLAAGPAWSRWASSCSRPRLARQSIRPTCAAPCGRRSGEPTTTPDSTLGKRRSSSSRPTSPVRVSAQHRRVARRRRHPRTRSPTPRPHHDPNARPALPPQGRRDRRHRRQDREAPSAG
jgi:hypothetical protein